VGMAFFGQIHMFIPKWGAGGGQSTGLGNIP